MRLHLLISTPPADGLFVGRVPSGGEARRPEPLRKESVVILPLDRVVIREKIAVPHFRYGRRRDEERDEIVEMDQIQVTFGTAPKGFLF